MVFNYDDRIKILFETDRTRKGIIWEIYQMFEENKATNSREFKEADHPRDEEGKFTKKNRGGIVELKTNTIGEYTGSREDYIKKVQDWYKNNLQGKSEISPILGKVSFYGSGFSETKHRSRSTPENLKYFPAIPEIIKKSKDVIQEDLKHYKPNVKCAYRIIGEAVAEDEKVKEIVILEDTNNKRFYTFDATKIISSSAHPCKKGGERGYIENIAYDYYDVNLIVRDTDKEVIEPYI